MKPTKQDLIEAHDRIKPYIHKTPVLTSNAINDLIGGELYFKCENLQKVGAFKMRGAANAVFSTAVSDRQRGFACHSSGNHGQAVALAAKLAGVPACVVMPENSNKKKMEAVEGYGAKVIRCEPGDESRQAACDEVVSRTEAQFIHPFDDYKIIAGQGTAAVELLEEIPELDFITCPIGGGGLVSGSALAASYFSDRCKVIGSEPENVNDAFLSFQKGEIDPGSPRPTLADGLRTCIGEKPFHIVKELVSEVQVVSEKEMISAMKLVWERMKIIIEPSSAVPIAAIIRNARFFSNKKTGVLITGGNVDFDDLPFSKV